MGALFKWNDAAVFAVMPCDTQRLGVYLLQEALVCGAKLGNFGIASVKANPVAG